MFSGDPTVAILGIADANPWAPGLEPARRLNIPATTDPRALIADPRLDLIIDVTGSAETPGEIQRLKPPHTEVMGGASAKSMWDLLAERRRSVELETGTPSCCASCGRRPRGTSSAPRRFATSRSSP
jgi:two-component system sensor histidine kinase DegS